MEYLVVVTFGFIIVMVACCVAGVYVIVQNIVSILYSLFALISVFIGLYILYKAVSVVKEKKSILLGITYVVEGLSIALLPFYICGLYQIANGYGDYKSVRYTLFDSYIKKYGDQLVCLFISAILIIVISISVEIAKSVKKRSTSNIIQILTITGVFVVFMGSLSVARKDEFQNSKDRFDFETPKYETITNVVAKSSFENVLFLNAHKFKEHTQLFGSNESVEIKGEKYILVSDGETMGFVVEKSMKVLYEEVFVTTKDTNIYYVESKPQVRTTRYGRITVDSLFPTDKKIKSIAKGTQVKYEYDIEGDFALVLLSDGTKGGIAEKYLETVKIPN